LKELEEIIGLFPELRRIVNYCWNKSGNKKRIK